MDGVDALRHRVRSMREKLGTPNAPQQWNLMLGSDDIPECIARQIGPHDKVYIHRIMLDYLGFLEIGSCTLSTQQGTFIVDIETGQRTAVKQDGAARRRRR